MRRDELYHWTRQIKGVFKELGVWQAVGLALYRYGGLWRERVGRVGWLKKLSGVGKADRVQRRLERWLANERIDWQACWRVWVGWVLGCWSGEQMY